MKRLILITLCLAASPSIAQKSITYIANEGILIQNEEQKILIDALFDDFYQDYLVPSQKTILDMNAKNSPYESIDLFLSTHAHRDHFYFQMVGDFLSQHSETYFISSAQAIDSLRKHQDFSKISNHVLGYAKSKGWKEFERNGITADAVFVRHGGRQNYGVHNFIYLVDIGGQNILHIGDSEMDENHFANLGLPEKSVDVALVPYWFMAYPPGQQIIEKYIKPDKLIGIHYPRVGDPKSLQMIREKFPNAVIFMKSGEKVDL